MSTTVDLTAIPQVEETVAFWRLLYGDANGGFFTVAAAGEQRPFEDRCYGWPDDAEKALAWIADEAAQGHNVWQSVNLFTKPERKSEHVASVRVLYTDDKADCPEAPPSIFIETSPGKNQGYWFLEEPVSPDVGLTLLRRLIRHVGADEGAKDLARVLRVPGTANCKYPEKPKVRIVRCDPGIVYTPGALDALLRKTEETAAKPRMTTDQIAALYVVRKAGEGRWEALRQIAGHELAVTHKPPEEVLEYAVTFNLAYCDPPYPKEEIARLVGDLAEKQKAKPKESRADEPVLTSLGNVPPRKAEYLSAPRLLRGELNVLAGPTGAGKSYLALDCAARLTSSRNLFNAGVPNWAGNVPGRVMYMSREDDEGIIRDRFDRLGGGDPGRLLLFASKVRQGREAIVSIADDLPTIERALRQRDPDLLVIDNLAGFLGARVDARRMNEVRPLLDELVVAAAGTRTAVLMIVHLNKRDGVNALERIAESAEFVYRPRSILFLAKDPDDPAGRRRVLAHEKNSYGAPGETLALAITDDGLSWEGATEMTARDLLVPERERSTASKLAEAMDFLRQQLTDGPRPAEEVTQAAWRAHIKDITLSRARDKLKVESYPHPRPGPGSNWYWRLPENGLAESP